VKLTEIKEKAKTMEINPGKMNKGQLIQAIQVKENNYPCFGTAEGNCDQLDCLWREDCIPT